ncbi:MAG: Signal peptidase-like protein [Cytophagales bacterium]|nr:MAG: Signal peptidase-like protein [Cytophagales bacterium]
MACSSCGTSGGCSSSGGGGCGKSGGCSSGGCNKMNAFDWLSNMEFIDLPKFDIVEVRFKGGRKEYYRNVNRLELYNGDPIVVEVQGGHHIGYVSLQGELVRIQIKKKGFVNDDQVKQIYRKATDKDLEKFESAKNREAGTLYRSRNIINEMKLAMKLTDVEYQADNTKASFYYSAEDRVDFRDLIKLLAGEFKVRIEMKQISLRQEAGRLGGIGSCGRELCCSTWLTDFKNVSTTAARYQNLSLNPAKLSGQCGRLKCCLNYELDTYMDALKSIPEVEKPLLTQKGEAFLQKTDIFRRIMWFGYKEDTNWYQLSVDRVNEILEQNKKGVLPSSLELDQAENKEEEKASKDKIELARFDDKFKKGNHSNKKKKSNPNPNSNPNKLNTNTQGNSQKKNPTQNPNNSPRSEQNQNKNTSAELKPNNNIKPRENFQNNSSTPTNQQNQQRSNRYKGNKPNNKQQGNNAPRNNKPNEPLQP